jgi:hypothetical protein
MKKQLFLLLLLLLPLIAFAQFAPYYDEADVIVKVKNVDGFLVPDFPKDWEGNISLCLVCIDGVNYYSDPIPFNDAIKTKDALCHIVYSVRIRDSVAKFAGKQPKDGELVASKKYQDITKVAEPLWAMQKSDYKDTGDMKATVVSANVEPIEDVGATKEDVLKTEEVVKVK